MSGLDYQPEKQPAQLTEASSAQAACQDEVNRLRPQPRSATGRIQEQDSKRSSTESEQRSIDLSIESHKPEKRTEAELKNLHDLQSRLLELKAAELLGHAAKEKAEGKQGKSEEMIGQELKQLKASMDKEAKNGQLGIHTWSLYQHMVAWIENDAMPERVHQMMDLNRADLEKKGLTIRDNLASTIQPMAGPNLGWMPSFPMRTAGTRSGSFDLGLDGSINAMQIPSDADLAKLDAARHWLTKATKTVGPALFELRLTQEVADRELPSGWLDRSGDNPVHKRRLCDEMVRLAATVQDGIKAMDYLNRAGGHFPVVLPPGCEEPERDAHGNISKVKLDLPATLDLKTEADKQKVGQLYDWAEKYLPVINQATSEARKAIFGDTTLLSVGEYEPASHSGRVKVGLDEKGKPTAEILPPAKDGDKNPEGKKYNLVTQDYKVKTLPDGQIEVTPIEQYWDIPKISPHNIWGTAVSEPIELKTEKYPPDSFVPVQRDGKIEMVQAKDLGKIHADDKWWQTYVEKGGRVFIDAAISAGLFYSGLGQATAAARLFSLQKGLGALRALVGLSGAMEGSAGANETELGRTAMEWRNYYFLADTVLPPAWNSLKWLNKSYIPPRVAGEAAEAVGELLPSPGKLAFVMEKANYLVSPPMSLMILRDVLKDREMKAARNHDPIAGAVKTAAQMNRDQAH